VWELLGSPKRHPEWWPRVIEVRGERFDEGGTYAQVTKGPGGRTETTFQLDRLDDMREIHMHCQSTGMYAHWLLTEAQDETFLEVEMGMEPRTTGLRVFDATAGRLYFRRWLEQSVDALKAAVEGKGGVPR
jgi:hypothetical protein